MDVEGGLIPPLPLETGENLMQLSRGFTPNIQSYVIASEGGYINHPREGAKIRNMFGSTRTVSVLIFG